MTGIGTDVDVVATREALRTDGFSVARGCVDPATLDALDAEAQALLDLFADGERSDDFWCYDVPGWERPILYRVHNLEKQGVRRIADLFSDGPLHHLAGSLLGEVRSTVCAMVVKTPGVAGVPWHRDRTNVPALSTINLSVFLDQATPANGCFEAVPGSHRLPDRIDVERTRDQGPRVHVPIERGDVLAHDVRLVHGSGDNPTPRIRRSIVMEFVATDRAQAKG